MRNYENLTQSCKSKDEKKCSFHGERKELIDRSEYFAIRGVLTCGQRYIFQKKRPYISHIYKIILQKTDKRKQL